MKNEIEKKIEELCKENTHEANHELAKILLEPLFKRKNREQVIQKLNEVDESDPEEAHIQADSLILEFLKLNGFEDVAQAYEDVVNRCAWWATA